MGRKRRERSPFDIYHVTSRGVGKLLIFEDDEDRRQFISLLQYGADKLHATILAWCLMGNHFHLVIEMPLEELSKLVGVTKSRYAIYFNERYERRGHLFEERFWSTPIKSEEQLLEEIRYVHQNPEKAQIASIDEYVWSSYRSYIDGVQGLANPAMVLGILGSVDAFAKFHQQKTFRDVPETKWVRMGEDEAVRIACQELELRNISQLLEKPQFERDIGIHRLKELGFSCSMLQRLTGLGKAVLIRA